MTICAITKELKLKTKQNKTKYGVPLIVVYFALMGFNIKYC